MNGIEISFTHPDEFMDELRKSAAAIEDKIVRITREWRQTAGPFRSVHALATAVVLTGQGHRNVLRLSRYTGDDWGKEFPESKVAADGANKIAGKIEATCEELGLEVRAGVFQIAEAA